MAADALSVVRMRLRERRTGDRMRNRLAACEVILVSRFNGNPGAKWLQHSR